MCQSWSSFLSFRHEKEHDERYFHSKEVQGFFTAVMATARDRVEGIPKGQRYWRAQLGSDREPLYDGDEIVDYRRVPYPPKRMKPLPEEAREGRVNPKGIPFLYLSTDENTAISEVRPWVGMCVTVVWFQTCRDLRLIDCSRGGIDPMYKRVSDLDKLFKVTPSDPEEAMEIVWRWVDLAFSEPVDHDDSTVGYIPTQIIAELFKANGFDGIKYKSLFNDGDNVALYDITSAEQVGEGKVVEVTQIAVDSRQICPFAFGDARS